MSDTPENNDNTGTAATTSTAITTGTAATSGTTATTTPQGQGSTEPTSSPSRPLNPGLYSPPAGNNNNIPDDTGESLFAITARIMSPPTYLYVEDGKQVVLNKTWAVGVIGTGHFEYKMLEDVRELGQYDELRVNGMDYGLSQEVYDWLCSPEDTIKLPAQHFV